MSEPTRRIFLDKQHPEVYKAQVAVAVAVRKATRDAGLAPALVELLSVRISQINGCAYCLDLHTRQALEVGETPRRLGVLPAWRDTAIFTEEERAALTLVESITRLGDVDDQDAAYAEASAVLSEDALSAVGWVAITMNAFNRLSITSRHPVKPERAR